MKKEIFNIFPTTIYVSEVENHSEIKKEFYKLYSKYDYNQKSFRDNEEWFNTTSENAGNPLIHLEESLSDLFEQVIDNVKIYTLDVLKYQDIFDYVITKLGCLDQERLMKILNGTHIQQVIYLFHII